MPRPCKLTFDLLTWKVVSESHVMWATSVPISVFLGLSVFDLGPMYVTETDVRQTSDVRRTSLLNAPHPRHNKCTYSRSSSVSGMSTDMVEQLTNQTYLQTNSNRI